MSEIALLPCPFCGGEAEIERKGDRRQSTIYSCSYCGCSLETSEEWDHGTDWNRRASPSPSPTPSAGVDAVAVKALPWSTPHPNTTFPSWHAQMPALRIGYSIKTGEMQLRGEFALFADFGSGSRWVSGHDTLDAAKAAAQADYEQRIRSALSPAATPVSEAGGEAVEGSGQNLADAHSKNPPEAEHG